MHLQNVSALALQIRSVDIVANDKRSDELPAQRLLTERESMSSNSTLRHYVNTYQNICKKKKNS